MSEPQEILKAMGERLVAFEAYNIRLTARLLVVEELLLHSGLGNRSGSPEVQRQHEQKVRATEQELVGHVADQDADLAAQIARILAELDEQQ